MDLSVLNDKQKEVVTAPLGPVLVLAGAGSGKTRVLTYRIAYLIEQGLVAPGNILALTFTNKAAKEMQERVVKLLKSEQKRIDMPTMGTFHSVCARLLRREIPVLGYNRGFVIYDAEDQLKILKEICEELEIGKRFPPSLFRAYISSAKNNVQTPAELSIGLEPFMHEMVQKVYVRYQNFLFNQNGVDFDDLLMLTIKIFQARPDILQNYQKQFAYILVDEYQDTNPAQYVLLSLLAAHHNLFVVGDDAQSIYGFRGSSIANILNFESEFSDARVYKLEQNYRSTKNILAVAESIIALNTEQKAKTLWTENETGPKIIVRECDNERDEAAFVVRSIVKHATGKDEETNEPEYEPEPETFSILDQFLKKQKKGVGGVKYLGLPQLPKDHGSLTGFAVLYRTHAQSRAIEEALIEAGIPYQIIGGVKFYERKEIKDMLAYLRLVQNFRDQVSLKRVINVPTRGIGDKSYQLIKQHIRDFVEKHQGAEDLFTLFRQSLESAQLPPKQSQSAKQFFNMIASFAELDPAEPLSSLLRLIYKKIDMEEWLQDGTEMGEARLENVQELFNVAAKYNHVPWEEGLESFLEEVALVTELDNLQETKNAVTLMTLHSAKGLEFDTVYFVGLEEGILPHSRSLLSPSELAEEVRLTYVGVTRAQKELYMLFATQRSLFGNTQPSTPSRFLRALPHERITANSSSFDLNDGDVYYEATDF
ncbi:MAG: UvrD-helicase domain-containing protein [Candidatus Doudnabacteria bacterium]|nr:UvrD-helicase domain-containing protein [Candidatus Doudnabacteria bacterium]